MFINRLNLDFIEFPELESTEKLLHVNEIKEKIINLASKSSSDSKKKQVTTEKNSKQCPFSSLIMPNGFNKFSLNMMQLMNLIEKWSQLLQPIEYVHKHFVIATLLNKIDNNLSNNYFGDIASSNLLCIQERNSSLPTSIKTRACLSSDGLSYRINGKKSNLINYDPNSKSMLLVVANASQSDEDPQKLSIFMVDPNLHGVTFTQSENCSTYDESETSYDLVLSDVVVPKEHMLTSLDQGNKIVKKLIEFENCLLSAMSVGIMKTLFTNTYKFSEERILFGFPLSYYEKTRIELTNFNSDLYLAESVTYYLAGMIDSHPDRDWIEESISCKTFCSEHLLKWLDQCALMMGHNGLRDELLAKIKRYSYYLTSAQTLNIKNRNFLSRNCMNHFVKNIDFVKNSNTKIINFLCDNGFLDDMKCTSTNNEIKPVLSNYLHPRAKFISVYFFQHMRKFSLMMNSLYGKHGDKFVKDELFLYELSTVILKTFSIFAGLSRISRIICLHLVSCQTEYDVFSNYFTVYNSKFPNEIAKLQKAYDERLSKTSDTQVTSSESIENPFNI